MKDQILKIAKVKNEAEFYRKYPTEEAFMKAHGKAFTKAAMGTAIVNKQLTQLTDYSNPPQAQVGAYMGGNKDQVYKPISFDDIYNKTDYAVTGSTDRMRKEEAYKQAQLAAAQKSNSGGGEMNIGQIAQLATMVAKQGKKVKKAQGGDLISVMPNQSRFTLPKAPQSLPPNSQPGIQYSDLKQPKAPSDFGKVPGPTGQVIDGIEKLKAEKKALDQSNQFAQVSGVVAQASGTRPEQARRRYVRPEDQIINPGELNVSYGAGTNYLAKDGAEIQNTFAPNDIYSDLGYEPLNDSVKQYQGGGFISNYGDQAADMFGNFGSLAGGGQYGESNAGGDIGGSLGQTAGTLIGGPVGGMIGKAAGKFIGSALDKNPQKTRAFNEQGQGNLQRSAFQQGAQQLQAQNAGFMEDGGWMNPEYNPQVITKFGNVDVSNIHNIFTEGMDNLRSGGHLTNYTPPSEEAMQTYAMGGELQTHWGGYMEPISYNPYLPGNGITYMPRGQSHDETNGQGQSGIGITYGNNPVEVERGEPITKLQDGGTGEDNILVYGNMKIPPYGISELQDKNAKGMKFKNYSYDLSKSEAKQNKIIDKSTKLVNDANDSDPFGQLSLASGQAGLIGANMKLKNIADKKQILAGVQNAILDTAKEHGLVADELAKGKIVKDKSSPGQAMYGAKMKTAQSGTSLPKHGNRDVDEYGNTFVYDGNTKQWVDDATFMKDNKSRGSRYGIKNDSEIVNGLKKIGTAILPYFNAPVETFDITDPENLPVKENLPVRDTSAEITELNKLYEAAKKAKSGPAVLKFQKRFHELRPEVAKQIIGNKSVTAFGKSKKLTNKDLKSNEDGIFRERTIAYKEALDNERREPVAMPMPNFPKLERVNYDKEPPKSAPAAPAPETPKKRDFLGNAFDLVNTVLPRFRGSNQEALDPNQLAGEMYALSTNQLEPVQAQTYQPRLQQPYDISYQDMLNANQSDFNALQRQVGSNPAALSALAAQKYGANEKVLGEQFRANQANKAGVYNQNLQTLNDATLKNLAIFDQQYTRQSQAKSNTKAVAQSALSSIASKIAQNKLENRKVGVNENLYNYRFDPITGRALNRNDLAQFNMEGDPFGRSTGGMPTLPEGYEYSTEIKKKKEKDSRNGSIVKALKNL